MKRVFAMNGKEKRMGDLIWREDAIDAMANQSTMSPHDRVIAVDTLVAFPSAETECTCCEYRVGDLCCYSDVKTDMEAMEEGEENG